MFDKKKYHEEYRKRKDRIANIIYSSQKKHSRARGHNPPTYTMQELNEWLYSQELFHVLYDNWKRLDYQKAYKPSVDRIDQKIGYTMANIQLMTWDENRIKGDAEQPHKPEIFHETNAIRRGTFKIKCKTVGWYFEDFYEAFSNKKYGKEKLYFYFKKED